MDKYSDFKADEEEFERIGISFMGKPFSPLSIGSKGNLNQGLNLDRG